MLEGLKQTVVSTLYYSNPNENPMNAPNISSLLDKPSSSIEAPKPLPVGTYTCAIQGQPRFDKSTKKGTEFYEFQLQILAAGEDVDEDALNEWAKMADGGMRSLSDANLKATYYITEASIHMLKKFCDDCGAGDETESLRQRVEQTPGCQVNVYVRHEASQDGTVIIARAGQTSAVE